MPLLRSITSFLILFFNNYATKIINNPKYCNIDKISQINVAKSVGLRTPDYILTSSKESLICFFEQHKERVITKNLNANLFLNFNGKTYYSYASIIDKKNLQNLPTFFFPSLFQEYISALFEIRVIVIGEKIFSVMLLTNSKESDIGINHNKNNIRFIPFNIPKDIEEKILKFMKMTNLQIASIDFLYNNENELIFLEANPSGQFLGYSKPCNYHLDKALADFLIEKLYEKN